MGYTSACTTNVTNILASDGGVGWGLAIRLRQSKSTTANPDLQL